MIASASEQEAFEQLVRKIDPHGTLRRAWTLTGGVSAQVTALEIERHDGQTQKVVVRRHGAVDLNEFRLLEILHSEGLSAPEPYYLDQSGEIFSTPYLVMEHIDGKTDFSPSDVTGCVRQLALQLARIHGLDWSGLGLSFLPRQEDIVAGNLKKRPANLDESLSEGRIRDALEPVWPVSQRNKFALLHGDYWPGNTLWKDDQLIGIIDWGDAALGDPLADLGNCRLDVLWAFGRQAMEAFTAHYTSMATIDLANLPYWDLCAALRPAGKLSDWIADPVVEKRMREQHRGFVSEAFDTLSARL